MFCLEQHDLKGMNVTCRTHTDIFYQSKNIKIETFQNKVFRFLHMIHELLLFPDTIENVSRYEGSTVKFSCPKTTHDVNVSWKIHQKGKLQQITENPKYSYSEDNLTISNVEIRDENQYYAVMTGKQGHIVRRCIFHLTICGKYLLKKSKHLIMLHKLLKHF